MFYLKHIILVIIFFSIFSCQTQLQKLGERHKTSIEKWYELGKFAESDLRSSNIKLVASFSLTQEPSNFYHLSDFRISVTEGFFDINLLQPSIEHKFLCNPVCKQLSELIVSDTDNSGVLSDFYFDQSEFDLFKFYGDLYLLNEHINYLNNFSPSLVKNYMLFLAEQNQSFSNLKEFMNYLKQSLNEENFYAFMNDPEKRFKAFTYDPFEAANWNRQPFADLPEYSNEKPTESLLWNNQEIIEQPLADLPQYSNEKPTESLLWNNQEVVNKVNDKNFNKNNISIGDLVCHGSSNSFGLVNQIQGKNVTVQLAGQLITFSEGILVAPKANEILDKKGPIMFTKLDNKKQYIIDEIEKCDVFSQ